MSEMKKSICRRHCEMATATEMAPTPRKAPRWQRVAPKWKQVRLVATLLAASWLLGHPGLAQESPKPIMGARTQPGPSWLPQPAPGSRAVTKASPAAPADAGAPTDTYNGPIRFPAEVTAPFDFVPMQGNMAYYRDFFTGGETTSQGIDGDSITAQIITPSNVTFSASTFTFHSTLTVDGQPRQNCWQSSAPNVAPLCDATTLTVQWFLTTQCQERGTYNTKFFRNGAQFASDSYHLLPTIPPHKVPGDSADPATNDTVTSPFYNQIGYDDPQTDQYGNLCTYSVSDPRPHTVLRVCDPQNHPDEKIATIRQFGCAMSSAAMMLGYFGLFTSPATLNTYLTNHDGYNDAGGVNWDVVTDYANVNNLPLSHVTSTSKTGDAASNSICKNGPTIIPVTHTRPGSPRIHHHFVLTWGRDTAETTYLLKDPNGGQGRQLNGTTPPFDYNNNYGGTRQFNGPDVNFEFPGDLVITLHSPAELLLTNSAGESTGLDPTAGTSFSQIPNVDYVDDTITDITDSTDDPAEGESKSLVLHPPAPDTYTLTVTGTDAGTYELEFRAINPTLQKTKGSVKGVPTYAGAVHKYAINTPITPGQPFPLAGSFNGGGQNTFLTFANPTRQASLVPTSQNNFPLIIFYGAAVNSSSFSASLNGQSLTSLFHPAAGAFETVNIPLPSGLSALTLQISGTTASGQTATDADTLQFDVGGSAPSAPTGLTATAITDTQINLAWTASTTSGVTYSIFRSTTSGFTPSAGTQIVGGLTGTTFADAALAASTTYFYLVEAVDPFASSAASNQASATTMTPGSCSGVASSIAANFNGTAIASGDAIWFSAVAKVSGLGPAPVTIFVRKSSISFTANGSSFTVTVPDANLTFDPSVTTATTTFDTSLNVWSTVVPGKGLAGNVFLDGAELMLPNGLPGGIKNVTWTATFSSDKPGISLNWQWAAAAYSSLGVNCTNTSPDFNELGVKPVDDNKASQYQNSDHAGTPEDYKSFVVGGATGGGGSNFTGSYSATKSVAPIVVDGCGTNAKPPSCGGSGAV
jgi:hypothetical protein